MGEKRITMIERILHRIEDHVELWRDRERTRETELASHREKLWAEAAEREKLLGEAVADDETERASLEEMTKRHRVVFVLHRKDLTGALETFAGDKDRLVNVVPGKGDYGSGKGIEGIRGSWLVFVPKGARRSTQGASEDFAYLTVHGRRGPLRIGARPEPV